MRTVGVEEELLLVDDAGVPTPVADRILMHGEPAREPDEPAALTGEMHLEMLEVVTRPHTSMDQLGREVVANRRRADVCAVAEGARAVALACSPLPVRPHPRRSERYRAMMGRYGAVPRRNLVCGLHVHVGIESEAEGVAVLDRIRTWTPILIALTANSPFHAGDDTGHASYRSVEWSRWPCSGPSELFGSPDEYHRIEDAMLGTGALLDAGMLYLDARLSRRQPTVEVRVSDVPVDARDTAVVAALVRALVDTAAREAADEAPAPDVPACVIRLANWRASLEGLRGHLVDPETGSPASAEDVVERLLSHVTPALAANRDEGMVREGVGRMLADGTGADRQRAAFARAGSLEAVVREAVSATHATEAP